MSYRTNNFDGPSYALQQKAYIYFQVMSNELNTPMNLVCPSDERTMATNFTEFRNSNLSYFVGLDADSTVLNMLLAGDRRIDNGIPVRNGIMELKTNQTVSWSKKNHDGIGHILIVDGSVQGYTSQGLKESLTNMGTNLTRLALP